MVSLSVDEWERVKYLKHTVRLPYGMLKVVPSLMLECAIGLLRDILFYKSRIREYE